MTDKRYLDNVIHAIDYIEDHLLDVGFSATGAAKHAGFSEYHFHRIFSSLVGASVADYIRARRLSQAAMALANEGTE
ncbi:MAG: helix-turn-helix domain-containing protein [Candidatus Obscuribacter sp.]|nr:helix-turn-helix domain-containing protein [Candidatus Obscuribacter sp.]